MNKEKIARRIEEASRGKVYEGELTQYAVDSIVFARSSYPVSNLIAYCQGVDVQFVITDMNTDESYDIDDVTDVHEVIAYLMERYCVDANVVYRKTAVHYTLPKNGQAHLSINTLIAVCSVLHCKLDFVRKK